MRAVAAQPARWLGGAQQGCVSHVMGPTRPVCKLGTMGVWHGVLDTGGAFWLRVKSFSRKQGWLGCYPST